MFDIVGCHINFINSSPSDFTIKVLKFELFSSCHNFPYTAFLLKLYLFLKLTCASPGRAHLHVQVQALMCLPQVEGR